MARIHQTFITDRGPPSTDIPLLVDNVLEARIARIYDDLKSWDFSGSRSPGFWAAGCSTSMIFAVNDQRPIFGRTCLSYIDLTPGHNYDLTSSTAAYVIWPKWSLLIRPDIWLHARWRACPTLWQTWFHNCLAISGRWSLPLNFMNCWMRHLFRTFGWASAAKGQRKSKQAYANYASTCWKHQ